METGRGTGGGTVTAVVPAPGAPGTAEVPADLDRELAALETGLYLELAATVVPRARFLVARAEAAGLTAHRDRARLVLADAESREDRADAAIRTCRELVTGAPEGPCVVAARAELVLAWCLHRTGLLAEALTHAVEAVRRLPPDAPPHLRVDHGMVLALLRGVQSPGTGYVAAFERVLEDAEALDDTPLLVMTLNNYAWLHGTHGRAADAVPLVARMQVLSRSRRVQLTATVLETVATTLLALGELAGAENVAVQALELSCPDNDARGRPEALITLARIRARKGDDAGALDAARQSGRLAVERDLPEIRALATEEEATLLHRAGDVEGAYRALRTSYDTWRMVHDRAAEDRATTLHTLYETDQAEQRSRLFEQLAERDALTGLWNRRWVDRTLPRLVGTDDPDGAPLCLAIVDVDRFKGVNDSRSHLTGDAVLVRLAQLMTDAVREPGSVARLGGEEFLLVLPGTGLEAATLLCESVRALVDREPWAALTDGLAVTVSVGVAQSRPGATVSAVLEAADTALYDAKSAGRNRVRAAGQPLPGGAGAATAAAATPGRPA